MGNNVKSNKCNSKKLQLSNDSKKVQFNLTEDLSKEEYIQIQSEAFYRALKRIDNEKINTNQENNCEEKKKFRLKVIFKTLKFFIIPFLGPSKSDENDHFENMYLKELTFIILYLIGGLLYIGTWVLILSLFIDIISLALIHKICFITICISLSSMTFYAAYSVRRINDETSLYGFTASVFSMVAMIIAAVSVVLNK